MAEGSLIPLSLSKSKLMNESHRFCHKQNVFIYLQALRYVLDGQGIQILSLQSALGQGRKNPASIDTET